MYGYEAKDVRGQDLVTKDGQEILYDEAIESILKNMMARYAVFLRTIHDHLKLSGGNKDSDLFTWQNLNPLVIFDYQDFAEENYSDMNMRRQILLLNDTLSKFGVSLGAPVESVRAAREIFRDILTGRMAVNGSSKQVVRGTAVIKTLPRQPPAYRGRLTDEETGLLARVRSGEPVGEALPAGVVSEATRYLSERPIRTDALSVLDARRRAQELKVVYLRTSANRIPNATIDNGTLYVFASRPEHIYPVLLARMFIHEIVEDALTAIPSLPHEQRHEMSLRAENSLNLPAEWMSVGISLGGTKIGAGLLDARGNVLLRAKEIKWQEVYGLGATPEQIIEGIIRQIKNLVVGLGLGGAKVVKLGVAVAGPVDEATGIAGSDFKTPNLPFDKYPMVQALREKMGADAELSANAGVAIDIYSIYNDGKAAAIGELVYWAQRGVRSLMAFIMGTGNNGTAVEDGAVYDDNRALLELGHNIMRKMVESVAYGLLSARYSREELNRTPWLYAWKFLGHIYRGKHPYQSFETGEKDFEDFFAGRNIAKAFAEIPEAADLMDRYAVLPENIQNVDRLLWLIRQETPADEETKELKGLAVDAVLIGITRSLAGGERAAAKFVRTIGLEIGRAFAVMVIPYQNKQWVERIIMVSGVGENFAKVNGKKDIFIASIRRGLREGLKGHVEESRIRRIQSGLIRSEISWERELLAAALTEQEIAAGSSRQVSMPYPGRSEMPAGERRNSDAGKAEAALTIALRDINRHYQENYQRAHIAWKDRGGKELAEYVGGAVPVEVDLGLSARAPPGTDHSRFQEFVALLTDVLRHELIGHGWGGGTGSEARAVKVTVDYFSNIHQDNLKSLYEELTLLLNAFDTFAVNVNPAYRRTLRTIHEKLFNEYLAAGRIRAFEAWVEPTPRISGDNEVRLPNGAVVSGEGLRQAVHKHVGVLRTLMGETEIDGIIHYIPEYRLFAISYNGGDTPVVSGFSGISIVNGDVMKPRGNGFQDTVSLTEEGIVIRYYTVETLENAGDTLLTYRVYHGEYLIPYADVPVEFILSGQNRMARKAWAFNNAIGELRDPDWQEAERVLTSGEAYIRDEIAQLSESENYQRLKAVFIRLLDKPEAVHRAVFLGFDDLYTLDREDPSYINDWAARVLLRLLADDNQGVSDLAKKFLIELAPHKHNIHGVLRQAFVPAAIPLKARILEVLEGARNRANRHLIRYALKSPHPKVRGAAVRAARFYKDVGEEDLLKIQDDEKSPRLASLAALTLAIWDSPAANLEKLVAAVKDDDATIRAEALYALITLNRGVLSRSPERSNVPLYLKDILRDEQYVEMEKRVAAALALILTDSADVMGSYIESVMTPLSGVLNEMSFTDGINRMWLVDRLPRTAEEEQALMGRPDMETMVVVIKRGGRTYYWVINGHEMIDIGLVIPEAKVVTSHVGLFSTMLASESEIDFARKAGKMDSSLYVWFEGALWQVAAEPGAGLKTLGRDIRPFEVRIRGDSPTYALFTVGSAYESINSHVLDLVRDGESAIAVSYTSPLDSSTPAYVRYFRDLQLRSLSDGEQDNDDEGGAGLLGGLTGTLALPDVYPGPDMMQAGFFSPVSEFLRRLDGMDDGMGLAGKLVLLVIGLAVIYVWRRYSKEQYLKNVLAGWERKIETARGGRPTFNERDVVDLAYIARFSRDEDNREFAKSVLASLGYAAAIPAAAQFLRTRQGRDRYAVLHDILDRSGRGLVLYLIQELNKPSLSARDRRAAVLALKVIGYKNPRALVDALQSSFTHNEQAVDDLVHILSVMSRSAVYPKLFLELFRTRDMASLLPEIVRIVGLNRHPKTVGVALAEALDEQLLESGLPGGQVEDLRGEIAEGVSRLNLDAILPQHLSAMARGLQLLHAAYMSLRDERGELIRRVWEEVLKLK
ncbi:MAG: ROK family protein, partial [Candidatus Omnitrophota bacterium]|nr:ROK family protein [Candidatus Omnitrophota bacterium]